jgi:hypothetical protein
MRARNNFNRSAMCAKYNFFTAVRFNRPETSFLNFCLILFSFMIVNFVCLVIIPAKVRSHPMLRRLLVGPFNIRLPFCQFLHGEPQSDTTL